MGYDTIGYQSTGYTASTSTHVEKTCEQAYRIKWEEMTQVLYQEKMEAIEQVKQHHEQTYRSWNPCITQRVGIHV